MTLKDTTKNIGFDTAERASQSLEVSMAAVPSAEDDQFWANGVAPIDRMKAVP